MEKFEFFKLPTGKDVTIRFLEPPTAHVIVMTNEEWERYNRATATCTCPFCEAGVPLRKPILGKLG